MTEPLAWVAERHTVPVLDDLHAVRAEQSAPWAETPRGVRVVATRPEHRDQLPFGCQEYLMSPARTRGNRHCKPIRSFSRARIIHPTAVRG
jgi:hypothetical protein